MLRILKIVMLTFVLLSFFVGVLYAEENDPIIAKAGDYIMKQSDLERLISYLEPEQQKYLQENPQQKLTLVKRMLEVRIISDMAKKEGFDKSPGVKDRLEYTINDELSREYLTKSIMKDVAVSEDDIKQYYDANKNKFSTSDQVRVRHILIRVPANASDLEKEKAKDRAVGLLERIKRGEDFAKLAGEASEDTPSKAKGGDLGYFGRGKMLRSFEDGAFSLKPGEVSEIIETQHGFHIIKMEDYKKGKPKDIKEVRDAIREQLRTEFAQSKVIAFIDKAMKDAGMAIYPDKIIGRAPKK